MLNGSKTIAAISTAPGAGGIGVVRVSGPLALDIGQKISGAILAPRIANFHNFKDLNGTLIDQGLILFFPAPHSFTGEDIIELQCHGGTVVTQSILNLCLKNGAKLAEPGDFTKRAYLNNKIDLAQAESVADLINASTEEAAQGAVNSLSGKFSIEINNLLKNLIELRMYVEACLDFPEEDIDFISEGNVKDKLQHLSETMMHIMQAASQGQLLRDGISLVLVGQPNVGKSSLLNLLSKRDVAIVSEEEGTTRDIIEVYLNIDGYPVIMADTAGIREAKNEVEKKGISLALNKSHEADLNLIVIDNSSKNLDKRIQRLINENSIIVLNKSDLASNQEHNFKKGILISVKKNKNIDQLITRIKKELSLKFILSKNILVTRERHRVKLNICLKEIDNFLKKDQKKDIEMAAEDLRLATRHLGSIVGKVDVEEILGSIFKDFCIGK